MPNIKTKYFTLSLYSITHAVVDAACIMLLLGGIYANEKIAFYIILYNVLAFGLQAPLGYLSDRIKKPEFSTAFGCLLIILALWFYNYPMLATIIVGSGNAIFHVGGGTIALNLNERKAALPGVFVSTGALGLFVGALIAKTIGSLPLLFTIILGVLSLFILKGNTTLINYEKTKIKPLKIILSVIILFLLTIVIRSIVGLSLNYTWKNQMPLLIAFTLAIFSGKALGGFISDKYGWIRITVGGLILSSLFLYFGYSSPVLGIIGILIFNFTMPVTLVAISNLLKGQPGFAFGLTTVALLLGALPTFSSFKSQFDSPIFVLIATLISSAILFISLKKYSSLTGI